MADGRHFENGFIRYISAADHPSTFFVGLMLF